MSGFRVNSRGQEETWDAETNEWRPVNDTDREVLVKLGELIDSWRAQPGEETQDDDQA